MHDAQQFLQQERFNSSRVNIGQIIIRMDKNFVLQIDEIFYCEFSEKLLFKCGVYQLIADEISSHYMHHTNHNYTINQLIELNKKAYHG